MDIILNRQIYVVDNYNASSKIVFTKKYSATFSEVCFK